MKTPKSLEALIDDGVIDEVIRPLKSGKEASVYVVRAGQEIRCAKVYKEANNRSFQKLAQYQEGRKSRGSRETRAMGKHTKFGKKQQEESWKNAEVDALYRLASAGVRVPKPFGFYDGVLIMELVVDANGMSAPRLGEIELSPTVAREYHQFLIRQVVRMLCTGLVHGDLSEFNVLVGTDGPVIIDLPQAVDAAGNNNAFAMLERDVGNLARTLGQFAPELLTTEYAKEIWKIYQAGDLTPDIELSGRFRTDQRRADVRGVMRQIDEARDEAQRRQRGRDEAAAD